MQGRWCSRDPIEERGGVNVYGCVGNDGVNFSDLIGLVPVVYKYPKDPRAMPQSSYRNINIEIAHHAETRWPITKVTCECNEDCDVSCTVEIQATISVNLESDDPVGFSYHEMMHIYSRSLGVKRRIVNPLKAEAPWQYDNPDDCEKRRSALEKDYQEMIIRYFDLKNHRKNTKNIHRGGGTELEPDLGANELSPGDGDPAPEITEEQHSTWSKLINDANEIEPVRPARP